MPMKTNGLKKSVWNIEQSDLDKIISYLSIGANVISTDRKAKLGKEKAIKVIIEEDDNLLEVYILASNKYIYMVTFVGNSKSDFDNEDYKMIKESFKLKDRTTNPIVIYILIIVLCIGIKLFVSYRKQKKWSSQTYKNDEIDYKNMTEEDFKKMDE